MRYLTLNDLYRVIRAQELDAITGENDQYLEHAESVAIDLMKSYLANRYVLTFFDSVYKAYQDNPTERFIEGQKVLFTGAKYATGVQTVGNVVEYVTADGFRVYKALTGVASSNPVSDASKWLDVAPVGSLYTVLADLPADLDVYPVEDYVATFEEVEGGDDRPKMVVSLLCDLVIYDLHKRSQPYDVPANRIAARDIAVQYLKDCTDVRKNIIMQGMTEITWETNQGIDTTWGSSNEKITDHNIY